MPPHSPKEPTFAAWTFGRYVDEGGQTASPGIFYTIDGKPAKRPLVLPISDIKKPRQVLTKLIDAGAETDLFDGEEELKSRLAPENLIRGIRTGRLGWHGDHFLTVSISDSSHTHDVIVELSILDIAVRQFGCAGTPRDWKVGVALPAKKSSYCATAILLAFAAPLLSRVFPDSGEGFLINLAGDSSLGKTACLMAGKSVSGPGGKLSTCDQSPRSLAEHAAAFSDTFMPIDDLDKVSSEPQFARNFTRITHSLTSGESKQYSAMVKGSLPDLRWTCCAMTGARTTVEELSSAKHRENHERVRCLDLKVPNAIQGGIWDRRAPGAVPKQLTDDLKAACCRAYGLPLRRWLNVLSRENTVAQAAELADDWERRQDLAETDAIGHRAAKKFAVLYAAGIIAVNANILPWDVAFVEDVVRCMHANARETLYPHEKDVETGLRRILTVAKRLSSSPLTKSSRPRFVSENSAEIFVRNGRTETLHLTLSRFEQFFASPRSAGLAIKRLDEASVFSRDQNQKATRQLRVEIAGEERRVRYLELNLAALKALSRGN